MILGGVGSTCLLRDVEGGFVAAKLSIIPSIQNPKLAKALNFREALSWIQGRGMDNVIIVSYTLTVVKDINNNSQDDSDVGLVASSFKFVF